MDIFGSPVMLGGGGSSSNAYAWITVDFTPGSTLTCYNGSKTLRAGSTTGTWVFAVPSAGTWTVKIETSGRTATRNASVTAQNQIIPISIAYGFTATTTAQSGVTYTEGFGGLSYDTIKKIAQGVSNNSAITSATKDYVYVTDGTTSRKFKPNTTSYLTVNSYKYALMGFNQYTLASSTAYGETTASGKTGLTFGMIDCHATTARMNSSNTNSGGWGKPCEMVTTCNNLCPSDLSSYITYASLPYCGTYSSATLSYYNTSKFFLPSYAEVYGNQSYSYEPKSKEGSQFAYYANGGSKVKKVGSSASSWWLRSVDSYDTNGFCRVSSDGAANGYGASITSGVAPCFCI